MNYTDENYTEIGGRIKELRKSLNMNQTDFAQILELKQSTLSYIEKGKSNLAYNSIMKLLENYSLNLNWLFYGIGNKFLKSTEKENKTDFAKVWQSTANSNMHTSNPVQLTSDARNKTSKSRSKNILVPVVAHAGYAHGWGDEQVSSDLDYLDIPGVEGEARTFEIAGGSMMPVLHDGDYVVCRQLERREDIKSNRIYVIVSSDIGVCAKYVRLREDGLYCLSANTVEYVPYLVPYDDVKEIWDIFMLITKNLSQLHHPPYLTRINRIEDFLSGLFPDFDRQ